MRVRGLHIAFGVAALGACAATPPLRAPEGPLAVEGALIRAEARPDGLAVQREGAPFHYSEGLAARRAGQAVCAAQGRQLRHGIRDRFDTGAWVFPGGCA